MDGRSPHLRCGQCRDVIGVYEPLSWQLPDGSILHLGYLDVRGSALAAHPKSRFYHRDCLPLPVESIHCIWRWSVTSDAADATPVSLPTQSRIAETLIDTPS